MLLTEINVDDLEKLERLRIDRLKLFFTASLPQCLIMINADMLTIYCLDPETIDKLLEDLEDLCSHSWLILGLKNISLYFGLEEILRTYIQ
jgi:hypothetical protein